MFNYESKKFEFILSIQLLYIYTIRIYHNYIRDKYKSTYYEKITMHPKKTFE